MSQAAISAIVVAYNSGPDLLRCCRAVLHSPLVAELRVFDNADAAQRNDHSIAELRATIDDPRLSISGEGQNIGFGPAVNRAAAQAKSPWLLLLNPDCLLPAAALDALFHRALSQRSIGIASVQLVDAHGAADPNCMRFDLSLLRLIGQAVPGLARLGFGIYQAAGSPWQAVPACSGALMLIPRAAFAALNGFDEAYFLHFEDLDLCRRMRAEGLGVWVASEIQVRHDKGGSSRDHSVVNQHKRASFGHYFDRYEARKFGPAAGLIKRILLALILRWR